MEKDADPQIPIGALAGRTGLAHSAIRFYETKRIVASTRTEGGQRRYRRSDIRRLSFVLIAQRLGFSLKAIRESLESLPAGRTPTKADWEALGQAFSTDIDQRIASLTTLRDRLASCIGCGCLSLKACHLYNAEDQAQTLGDGPRYLVGDEPGTAGAG